MQRLVEELRVDLAEFVEQRDALTLVLWAKQPADTAYAHQLLDSMDQSSNRDVFLLFADDCFDIDRYVDSLMAACDMDIDLGNEAIERGFADEGMEPWPSLPPRCFEDRLRPIERIQALVAHIRTRFPDPTHRIVFGLLPHQLSNPDAYLELAMQLVPWSGYEPWMAGVRVVLRDTHADSRIVRRLSEENAFGTLVRPVDFSPDALSQALVDTVDDRDAEPEERMGAFVQVAGLDQAWGRYDEAIGKYGVANAYYTQTNNIPMQSLCVLQTGYAEQLAGRTERARLRFRQALQMGLDNDIKQVALNASLALGQMHLGEEDWATAAEYWEGTALLARALNSLFVLADACQQAGVCQLALNDTDKALEFWDAGKTVAEQVAYWDRRISILGYMIDVEGRNGRNEERELHERELKSAQDEWVIQQHEVAQARKNTGAGATS